MSNSENDGMETAIEGEPVRRPLTTSQRIQRIFQMISEVIYGEKALIVYIFIHWIMACGTHMSVGDEESTAFISFLYFLSTVIAFLAMMAHVSALLVPLFLFCSLGSLVLFYTGNVALLGTTSSSGVFSRACSSGLAMTICESMREGLLVTTLKLLLAILLFTTTCTAIIFQLDRNTEFNEHMAAHPQHPIFLYHPHLMDREAPVGATNLDEPPRYSSLEPVDPAKPPATTITSPVTSPPRYSYWERTFGKGQTAPTQVQESPVSDRSKKSSKTISSEMKGS